MITTEQKGEITNKYFSPAELEVHGKWRGGAPLRFDWNCGLEYEFRAHEENIDLLFGCNVPEEITIASWACSRIYRTSC